MSEFSHRIPLAELGKDSEYWLGVAKGVVLDRKWQDRMPAEARDATVAKLDEMAASGQKFGRSVGVRLDGDDIVFIAKAL